MGEAEGVILRSTLRIHLARSSLFLLIFGISVWVYLMVFFFFFLKRYMNLSPWANILKNDNFGQQQLSLVSVLLKNVSICT